MEAYGENYETLVDKMILLSGGQADQIGSAVTTRNTTMALVRASPSQMTRNNVTVVKATLGREATIKCVAEHLVGQKTVSRELLEKV